MLLVPTIIKPSRIHGLGCFATEAIPRGARVWELNTAVDHRTRWHPAVWEWDHSYRSHVASFWILPRDNAAWMNFDGEPNLEEGELINGEPELIAARDIAAGEELTVPLSSDLDAAAKISGEME